MRRIFTILILGVGFGLMLLFLSRMPLAFHTSQDSLLTLAIRYVSQSDELCRKATEEEKAKMLPHMRREEICERERKESRVVLSLDGAEIFSQQVKPLGFRADGLSVLLHNFPVTVGEHEVKVELRKIEGETISSFEQRIYFDPHKRYLVEYQKDRGFELF